MSLIIFSYYYFSLLLEAYSYKNLYVNWSIDWGMGLLDENLKDNKDFNSSREDVDVIFNRSYS